MVATLSKDVIAERDERIKWFYSLDLDGIITAGRKPVSQLMTEADIYFAGDILHGKSVVDIGAWDGFLSFEAERRGASRVVATDWFCWSGPGWGTRAGFDLAHEVYGSDVEAVEVDVFGLDPEKIGRFDVVLFLGVLYHLTDPWGGLKRAADLANDMVIVETVTAMNEIDEPVMRYYLGDELNGDPTNFWAPNEPCLLNMLREFGFTRFETLIRGGFSTRRIVVRGWR